MKQKKKSSKMNREKSLLYLRLILYLNKNVYSIDVIFNISSGKKINNERKIK